MTSDDLQWVEPEPVAVPNAIRELIAGPNFLAEAVVRRGLVDADQLQSFLDPNFYRPTPPSDLPDLVTGTERILNALQRQQVIGVWGDFDVDGQSATALLVETLRWLGADVRYFIPIRARDSHGMALPALTAFLDQGIELLITCDTGISAYDAVAYARSRQVDVIVTDHHTLPEILPPALAVINPQRLPTHHPLFPLCGVGCAFKLAEELLLRSGLSEHSERLLDLVALGTVADLAALTGENRYLVQRGLECLRRTPRPAIEAILQRSETAVDHLTEEHISFLIAPRLNALGRLGDANPAVPFLLADSVVETISMAERLEAYNAQRKLLTDQVFQAAQAQIKQDHTLLDHAVLLLSHPTWPGGVLGLVASRFTELYRKPTILLATPPGQLAHGSARSIEGINITQAIASAEHLLAGFGGHPMAAGLSVQPQNMAELVRQLDLSVRQQQSTTAAVVSQLKVDAYISLPSLSLEFVASIDRLAPFGPGNPPLVLASRNLKLASYSPFGKNREHLQLLVEDPSGAVQKLVWWQGAAGSLPDRRFDLAFSVSANDYRGTRSVQAEWLAFRQLPEGIALRSQPIVQRIIDLRNELNPASKLAQWSQQPDTIVFAEGEAAPKEGAVNRNQCFQAHTLVLWTLPPGRDELQSILETVAPQQVIWFGLNPGSDTLPSFLTRLAALVRFAIKSRSGQAGLAVLAAATAQRELAVKTGLAWLAASGHITAQFDSSSVILEEPGMANPEAALALQTELQYLLRETAAFRTFCQKADLRSMIL